MENSDAKTSFILLLIGGVLTILSGLAYLSLASFFAFIPIIGTLGIGVAIVGVVCGIVICVSGVKIKVSPKDSKTWAILGLIFSFIGWIGGAGFGIGFLLGLIGSAKAL